MLECQSAVLNSRVFKIIEVDENAPIGVIFWNGRIYSQVESSLLLAAVSSLFETTILCFLSKEIISISFSRFLPLATRTGMLHFPVLVACQ